MIYNSMKGGCRMDKDMERLGKERLKRVRRRRQLATFIISMAVIVLGITAYRLIQPASAADQNQKDFTIDNVTENYVNLQKHAIKWLIYQNVK